MKVQTISWEGAISAHLPGDPGSIPNAHTSAENFINRTPQWEELRKYIQAEMPLPVIICESRCSWYVPSAVTIMSAGSFYVEFHSLTWLVELRA